MMKTGKQISSIIPFLCFFLAFGSTHGSNHVHDLLLSASLKGDATQETYQKVDIKCCKKAALNLSRHHVSEMRSSSDHVQSVPDEREFQSEIEILMNGTNLETANFSDIVNYTSVKVENRSIHATFYVRKTKPFCGQFFCQYVNKTQNPTSVISSEALLLMYAPYNHSTGTCKCDQSTWKYLAILFLCLLFIVLLALLVVIILVLVKRRFQKHRINKSHQEKDFFCEKESSTATAAHFNSANHYIRGGSSDVCLKKQPSSCSESCYSQEEATNAILLYLAHPTPCLEENCPCIQYKQMLDQYKSTSSKCMKRTQLVSSAASSREDVVFTDNAGICQSVLCPDSTSLKTYSTSPNESKCTVVYPELSLPSPPLSSTILSDSSSHFVVPPDLFEVSSYGGCYSNEDHQVYLRVPEGSIPKGKTIQIKIGISLNSSLVSLLPPENFPVSPIVSFHVVGEDNFEFLKPVEIILPHCVDIEDKEDAEDMELTFLKSRCNLYCFHQSKGMAIFKPKSHTASLMTNHFCSFCIVANKKIPANKIHYGLVKVVPRNQQVEWWRASFCVTYYLRTCMEALKKQYPEESHEMKSIKRFKFPKSEYISIHFERNLPGGWHLGLETSDKIYAKSVEYWKVDLEQLELMEENGQYPPRFEVQVGSSQAREAVIAHIFFKGVMTEEDSSHEEMLTELILQPPPASTVWHHHPGSAYPSMTGSCSMPTIALTRSLVQPPHIQPLPLKLGSYPSHSNLMNLVAAPLPTKWRLVGIQLGLSMATLNEIESSFPTNCKRCFSAMFSEWERQNTSPYTWTTIIEALRSSSVLENVCATKIEESLAYQLDSMSLCSNSTACGFQSTE